MVLMTTSRMENTLWIGTKEKCQVPLGLARKKNGLDDIYDTNWILGQSDISAW